MAVVPFETDIPHVKQSSFILMNAVQKIAIAHANGGNDLLRGVEAERLNRLDKLKHLRRQQR